MASIRTTVAARTPDRGIRVAITLVVGIVVDPVNDGQQALGCLVSGFGRRLDAVVEDGGSENAGSALWQVGYILKPAVVSWCSASKGGVMRAVFAVAVVCLGLSGCFRSTEMQTSANTYQLHTEASGLLYQGKAGQENLRKAAELTLKSGYTHFKLEGAAIGQGQQYAGNTPGSVNVYGNTAILNPGAPIMVPTSQATATVVMFRQGDPGFPGSLDAALILRQAQS